MNAYEEARRAADELRERGIPRPRVGLVLGSGLGPFADTLESLRKIPYREIPGFHAPTVIGHAGYLCAGRLHGTEVVALQGRLHHYEGHDIATVVHPTRVVALLGAEAICVTNAAGGIREDLEPGDLMLLCDHINLLGTNPLRGPNDERFGLRFPDMTQAYDPHLRALAHEAAREHGLALREGVYAAVPGPSYETPAEIRFLRAIGADAVGMSTVPEVIAARHLGARVVGLSCVTNRAAGLGGAELSHAEVEHVARAAHDRLRAVLSGLVRGIARDGAGVPS